MFYLTSPCNFVPQVPKEKKWKKESEREKGKERTKTLLKGNEKDFEPGTLTNFNSNMDQFQSTTNLGIREGPTNSLFLSYLATFCLSDFMWQVLGS